MNPNTRSLFMLGVVTLIVSSVFVLLNNRINSQIGVPQPTETPTKKPAISEKSQEVLVTEVPRKPVIDPYNDPLAPRVKSLDRFPASPVKKHWPSQKIYQPSVGNILIQ